MQDESSRLTLFRATCSEIRGSEKHLVVGIDVGKEKHHAFYGTPKGKTFRRKFVFQNRRADFEDLRALARDLAATHGLEKIVFGLEPTGVYHKPLLEYLIRQEEHVVIVSNVAVKRNRELLDGRWDKNDVTDAANVADLLGQARCLYADDPQEPLRQLRELVGTRARLGKQEHRERMRIRNNLVAQYFPELECGYTQGGGDALVLRVLSECFDPVEIGALSFEQFWKTIVLPRWGKSQHQRAEAIWQASKTSVGCTVSAPVRAEAGNLVRRLTALRADLQEVEREIASVAKTLAGYASVISIPGVGPVISAMILAAIGDPNRFSHPRQVLRLAGMDLCASRSGKSSDRVVPKISKQGKAMLRYGLVQAARLAPIHHPAVRAYFARLLVGRDQERGIRLKMHVKLASKLLVIAWTLMKRGQTFDPKKFTG
ncbi:MAG: IS110 family transposase [Deltaproteobacteria bacterium]|nr:IS110 family transposase [Deltaproteobacteria bacterium]